MQIYDAKPIFGCSAGGTFEFDSVGSAVAQRKLLHRNHSDVDCAFESLLHSIHNRYQLLCEKMHNAACCLCLTFWLQDCKSFDRTSTIRTLMPTLEITTTIADKPPATSRTSPTQSASSTLASTTTGANATASEPAAQVSPDGVDSTTLIASIVGGVVGLACIVAAIVALVVVSRRRGRADGQVDTSRTASTTEPQSGRSSDYGAIPPNYQELVLGPADKSDYVEVRLSQSESNYGHGDIVP